MLSKELIDAREALQLLSISEEELTRRVSSGELRAFRSQGTLKFRREDVLGLKLEHKTDPTIILPASTGTRSSKSGILTPVAAPVSAPDPNQTYVLLEDDLVLPGELGVESTVGTVIQPAVPTPNETVVELPEEQRATGKASAVPASKPISTRSRVNRPGISATRAGLAKARRIESVYEVKTRHPFLTALLIAQGCAALFALSIFTMYEFKGHYDADANERVIPPFLQSVYEHNFHGSWFTNLPGTPKA
jgi:hypothetical protein